MGGIITQRREGLQADFSGFPQQKSGRPFNFPPSACIPLPFPYPAAFNRWMISRNFPSASALGNCAVPAPVWPPPPYSAKSCPTFVLQVRLKMLCPSEIVLIVPSLPSHSRAETLDSGKRV